MSARRLIRAGLLALSLLLPPLATADEPKRPLVDEVRFEGNEAFSESKLEKVLATREASIFFRRRYYPQVLEDDIQHLKNYYTQRGYLDMVVLSYDVVLDTAARKVEITIRIDEGLATLVEGISIFGNEVFGEEQLRQQIKLRTGKALDDRHRSRSVDAVLQLYGEHGYMEASVKSDVRVKDQENLALVDFIITEGRQFFVGQVQAEGIERTRPHVVYREVELVPGDTMRYSDLLELQRDLYLTGLFESVFVRPGPITSADSSRRSVRIELSEGYHQELNASVGVGTLELLRGQLEWRDINLVGTGRKLGFTGRASFIDRALEASFTEPWTFGSPWTSDLLAFWTYDDKPAYDLYRQGGSASIGREFGQNRRTTFRYRHENAKLRNVVVADEAEEIDTRIRSFRNDLTWDNRDNLFDPSEGYYVQLSNEWAGAFLNGSSAFLRSSLTLRGYFELRSGTVLASGFDVAIIPVSDGLMEVPLNERLYAGGPLSVRGFGYEKLGPLDEEGDPMGGRFRLALNVIEWRQHIWRWLNSVLFYDAGLVTKAPLAGRIEWIRSSFGTGLRVDTPIGLGRVDVAFPVDAREHEAAVQFWFGIGHAF